MRWSLSIPILVAALAAAVPAASAQEDACVQANPCEWYVVVGSTGFLESNWNWTAGDWLKLVVSNDDDVAHTVSIDGTAVSVQAGAIAEASSAPFQLAVGSYTLRDQPSGDTAKALAVKGDVVQYENGLTDAGTSSKGRIPGFEAPLAAAALVGLALVARRR